MNTKGFGKQDRMTLLSHKTLLIPICLLLAVLFPGSAVYPNISLLRGLLPEGLQSREDLEKLLHERASKALRHASFPRTASIETFTACVLIQVTWMRFEEPLTTCSFIGLAYRVAQSLDLHREPSNFASIKPITAEVRRRVWWVLRDFLSFQIMISLPIASLYLFSDILSGRFCNNPQLCPAAINKSKEHAVHIDITVAPAAGLPPMIDLSTSNVRPVSELENEFIGTPEALGYEARLRQSSAHVDQPASSWPESMVSTASILQQGKYNICGKSSFRVLYYSP